MLQSIRDNVQGIVIWAVIGLIIISFALWGIQGYLGGGKQEPVASVNGVEITQQEVARAAQSRMEQLQQMLGANYRPGMFDEGLLKRQALEELVQRQVLLDLLNDANFAAAPEQVRAAIQKNTAFQDTDGKFSMERYRQLLGYRGLAPEAYEHQVASDLVARQLYQGVVETAFVTPEQARAYERLLQQQREVGYLTLPVEGFLPRVTVSDAQVSEYYDKHKAQFKRPERLKVNYLDLSVEKLADQIKVGDDEVRRYYESHKQAYTTPEQRRARHILIAVGDKHTPEQAKALADDLRKKLENGASFAELAKQYSDDPGSAQQGGELGYFGRGTMDKAFEQAAFSLQEGQISQPVHSEYGYHLIKLEDIRPARVRPLSEVADQIRHELRMQQAEPRFNELVEKVGNLAYEHSDSLQAAADEAGLKIQTSDFFSRQGGTGVASQPKVVQAAFSDDVLHGGYNSEMVELGPTHYVVLHLAERKPAEQKPLEEVGKDIRTQLQHQQATQLAKKAADQAVQRLRSGTAGGTLAKQWPQATWVAPVLIPRDGGDGNDGVPAAVRQTAFALPHPPAQGASAGTTMLRAQGKPAAAAVGVFAVKTPPAAAEKADKSEADQLARQRGAAEFQATLQQARDRADIELHEGQ